jgi:hypothetical protein
VNKESISRAPLGAVAKSNRLALCSCVLSINSSNLAASVVVVVVVVVARLPPLSPSLPVAAPPLLLNATRRRWYGLAFIILTEFTVPTGKRVNTREACHWITRAWQRFKRSKGVKINGTH